MPNRIDRDGDASEAIGNPIDHGSDRIDRNGDATEARATPQTKGHIGHLEASGASLIIPIDPDELRVSPAWFRCRRFERRQQLGPN